MSEERTRDHLMASPPIDITSLRGMFGWTVVDSIAIPHIYRQEKKYVPVRVVEQQFVSRYLKAHPHFLNSRPPLISHYVTETESNLLNEVNAVHCQHEYGEQPFTKLDLIVKLSDFEQYYEALKLYHNHTSSGMIELNEANKIVIEQPRTKSMCQGGWIQLNNTVMPYLLRHEHQYVPLAVIKYAAKLLTDVDVTGNPMVVEEWQYLNEACRSAGLQFEFSKKSKLIPLQAVLHLCKSQVKVQELPPHNPFLYAEYQFRPDCVTEYNVKRDQTVMNIKRRIANYRTFTPNLNKPNGLPAQQICTNASKPNTSSVSQMGHRDRNGWPGTSVPAYHAPMQPPRHLQHSTARQEKLVVGTGSPHGVLNRHKTADGKSPNVCVTPNGFCRQSFRHTHHKQEVLSNGDQPLDLSSNDKKLRIEDVNDSQAFPAEHGLCYPAVNGGTNDQQIGHRPVITVHKRKQNKPTPHALIPNENTIVTSQCTPISGQNGLGSSPVESAPSPSSTPGAHDRSTPRSRCETSTESHASNMRYEIRRVKFHGKIMSVLTNNQQHLALLEVAVRLFFPSWDIDNFHYTLKEILGVKIFTLSREEEKAFIKFYGLPTDSLECNKAVRLMDLKNKMEPLEFIFEAKRRKMQQKQGSNLTETEQEIGKSQKEMRSNETHLTNNNALVYSTGTMEESLTTSAGSGNPIPMSRKRPGVDIIRSGNVKKLNKSLENTLARLKGIQGAQ